MDHREDRHLIVTRRDDGFVVTVEMNRPESVSAPYAF